MFPEAEGKKKGSAGKERTQHNQTEEEGLLCIKRKKHPMSQARHVEQTEKRSEKLEPQNARGGFRD